MVPFPPSTIDVPSPTETGQEPSEGGTYSPNMLANMLNGLCEIAQLHVRDVASINWNSLTDICMPTAQAKLWFFKLPLALRNKGFALVTVSGCYVPRFSVN